MRFWRLIIATALLSSASAIHAESGGVWRVNGAIGGRAVVLDCRLEPSGGMCVDAAPGGKSHPLVKMAGSGNQLSWSFKTRYLFMDITLAFAGRVAGDRMSGTIAAAGRSGTFTATRR